MFRRLLQRSDYGPVVPIVGCCGQTTGNVRALKYYMFPINDLPHRTLIEKKKRRRRRRRKKKNRENTPSEGHPRAHTLAEFEENSPDLFFSPQYANNSEPLSLDPCALLKIQIPMQSISFGCPKIVRHSDPISPLISKFGIHLEPGSEKSWSNHSLSHR